MEDLGAEGLDRAGCTRRFVRTVGPSARSPSSLPREGRFTAGSAGRGGGSEEAREERVLESYRVLASTIRAEFGR
jgi:hypothetical protein